MVKKRILENILQIWHLLNSVFQLQLIIWQAGFEPTSRLRYSGLSQVDSCVNVHLSWGLLPQSSPPTLWSFVAHNHQPSKRSSPLLDYLASFYFIMFLVSFSLLQSSLCWYSWLFVVAMFMQYSSTWNCGGYAEGAAEQVETCKDAEMFCF
jgi:hypothetical protein